MLKNALRLQICGAGPAHLYYNPAPKSCLYIALMNFFIAAYGFTAFLYSSYALTSFGIEIPQYLCVVSILGIYSTVFFFKVSLTKELAETEWTSIIMTTLALNFFQYCSMVWGIGLCYRMLNSRTYIGTRMYFYFSTGIWMNHTILGISIMNSFCIVYTTYIALVVTLVSLMKQMGTKRSVR